MEFKKCIWKSGAESNGFYQSLSEQGKVIQEGYCKQGYKSGEQMDHIHYSVIYGHVNTEGAKSCY